MQRSLLASTGLTAFSVWENAKAAQIQINELVSKSTPIVDTHFHMWDIELMDYPWLNNAELLNRNYLLDDYIKDTKDCNIEKMVFVECGRIPEHNFNEVDWVSEQAHKDPRIQGIVAWLPVYEGKAIEKEVVLMKSRPLVKGIRCSFDPTTHHADRLIQGLQLLGKHNLSFDLNTSIERNYALMTKIIKQCPGTQFMLDHLGNPDIEYNAFDTWCKALKTISGIPNLYCKISGIISKAGAQWNAQDLRSFVEFALEVFGPDRVLFGGDWPVVLLGGSYRQWIEALALILKDYGNENKRKLFTTNAEKFYKL